MQKLSEAEILERLPKAKDWERHGDMLVRVLAIPVVSPRDGVREPSGGPQRQGRSPPGHDRQLSQRSDGNCPLTMPAGSPIAISRSSP